MANVHHPERVLVITALVHDYVNDIDGQFLAVDQVEAPSGI